MDTDGESTEQLVSTLAREAQRRQEETRTEARRPQPDYILEVLQSEVRYTLPPRLLPLPHVDYQEFARVLRDRWDVRPNLSEIRVDAATIQKLQGRNDFDEALMEHVLRSSEPTLRFEHGRYKLSDFDFVTVRSIRIDRESVHVSVAGISRVAEAVAQEVVEAISASAGASRSWASIEPEVQVVTYGTATRTYLGSDDAFENMLSPGVRAFFREQVASGGSLGSQFGPYFARHGLKAPPRSQVAVALDELELLVTRFDPDTGIGTQSDVRFSVTARSEYGTGVVRVSSELPYEVHVEVLGKLIASLETGASTPNGD